ncbi:MAG: phytanoyl-CoA dioxygenase family protein, partial [Alphaproteobacteria bacterium]|nr:phytanoyl-CoA dioxygenase family protein [Alphaproteobacteria bacterium]
YHRDGYVIPQSFRLSDTELKTLRDAVYRVLEDNADVLPDRMINTHLDGGAPYGIRGQKAIHDIARDPRILDMAQAVMGPDLILLFSHLFCKPAASNRSVP